MVKINKNLVSQVIEVVNTRIFADNVRKESINFSNNYDQIVKKIYEIDSIIKDL